MNYAKKKIIIEYLDGKSVQDIADECGVNRRRIYTILAENNIKPNRQVNCDQTTKDKIIEMHKKGKSYRLIMSALGVSKDTVYRTLKSNNIKISHSQCACPFYKYINGRTIICEAIKYGSSTGTRFMSDKQMKAHLREYCCDNYQQCYLYEIIEKKYRD